MYRIYIKRILDIVISLMALLFLSPVMLILSFLGWIKMKGNPFFFQKRPGKNGVIFKLVKFKSMSMEKDENGNLLPDSKRLNRYGKVLRSTSLDELPELINILKGDMSLIGPRPLSVMYLPFYSDDEMHRHDVRPGLSGLAQVNGRNVTTWEERFTWDLKYVNELSFLLDCKIFFLTIYKVINRSDIGSRQESGSDEGLMDFEIYRQQQWDKKSQ
ncbi:sugar transferase [Blautia sp. An249]|nr:sugar transferase [Blautia sp. An249]